LVTKPTQPGKPSFNIKETRVLHDPYPNQFGGNGITKVASKPENFSNPPAGQMPNEGFHNAPTLSDLAAEK